MRLVRIDTQTDPIRLFTYEGRTRLYEFKAETDVLDMQAVEFARSYTPPKARAGGGMTSLLIVTATGVISVLALIGWLCHIAPTEE